MTKLAFTVLLLFFCFNIHSQAWLKMLGDATEESNKGNYSEAAVLMKRVLKEAEKDKVVTKDDLMNLRSSLASNLVLSGNHIEGFALFSTITNELESVKVKPWSECAIRGNYGNLLISLGYNKEALPQFQKSYDIAKIHPYDDKDENVIVISSLALASRKLYKFKKAEELYKEAIAYSKKEKLTGSSKYPSLYAGLGILYTNHKFETKALDAYQSAEESYRANKDTISTAFGAFLLNYAILLNDVSQFEKALPYSFQAKNYNLKYYGEISYEYAAALNNIGLAYSKMNKITETEQFYNKAIQILKALPETTDQYLTSLTNLAVFYNSVGRKEDAKLLEKEIEKGLLNPKLEDTLCRADLAFNLGMSFKNDSEYKKSEKYFNDALVYYRAVYGKDDEKAVQIYIQLSEVKLLEENYDEAVRYLKLTAQIYSKIANPTDAGTIEILCAFARILESSGLPEQGEEYLNKAIEIAKVSQRLDQSMLENLYVSKAQNSAGIDKADEALEYFNKYLELKYTRIAEQFAYMTEQEKMAFMDEFEITVKNFYALILRFVNKRPDLIKTLIDFRLKTKGLLLNNVSQIKKQIIKLNDPALNKKYETLKTSRENISKLMSLNTDDYPEALSEIEALKKEADVLEKEISLKVSAEPLTKQNISWKNIQKQLLPDEAAIEILQINLVYKDKGKGTNYSYLIIKSTGDPVLVRIDEGLNWEKDLLNLYRKNILDKTNEPGLYNAVWQHADEQLTGINTLYLSPDGIYNQINLNTLINSRTKKYLLEEKNIHYITSLQDIINLKQSPSKKPFDAVLVGNPSFGYDLTKLPKNKSDFGDALALRGKGKYQMDDLPGTKAEIDAIKIQLIKDSVKVIVFEKEQANEIELKKIKNPGVLHLATHGFFEEDYPEEVLAQFTKTEQIYYRNPMIRSGIFLSGANNNYGINAASMNQLKDFEDGLLSAYEVVNLNLEKTELVVLSACETGLGKVKNGEGVFGLQRAFKQAGAKSVIMSLWPVSDEATKDLMISFYESWIKTGNIYLSFKEAQIAVKKKYPEPYYWGAFILNGR